MKLVAAGAMVILCGCLISPVMRFGEGKSAHQVQQEGYERVTPASFTRGHEWAGEVSTARIRVWADDAYRAQNVHWQQTVQNQLDAANEVLAATFGVRLVADYRVWQRHAADATLEDSLAALGEADAGDDVLSVVGLTSSISLVSETFERLGKIRKEDVLEPGRASTFVMALFAQLPGTEEAADGAALVLL